MNHLKVTIGLVCLFVGLLTVNALNIHESYGNKHVSVGVNAFASEKSYTPTLKGFRNSLASNEKRLPDFRSIKFPAYGDSSPIDFTRYTFPNYFERVGHAWINYARADPRHFVEFWMAHMVTDGSHETNNIVQHPPVPLMFWSLDMGRAARAHSFDRFDCEHFDEPHLDCNYTTTGDRAGIIGRLSEFYGPLPFSTDFSQLFLNFPTWTLHDELAEYYWPFFYIGGLICNGNLHGDGSFSACLPDTPIENVRAREIILLPQYLTMGYGTEYRSGSDKIITTVKTMAKAEDRYSTRRVASAVHVMDHVPTRIDSYFFMLNVDAGMKPVRSARVHINDDASTIVSLCLLSGNSTRGNYVSPSYDRTASIGCLRYKFSVTFEDDTTEEYPKEGYLWTIGVGSCTYETIPESPNGGDSKGPGAILHELCDAPPVNPADSPWYDVHSPTNAGTPSNHASQSPASRMTTAFSGPILVLIGISIAVLCIISF